MLTSLWHDNAISKCATDRIEVSACQWGKSNGFGDYSKEKSLRLTEIRSVISILVMFQNRLSQNKYGGSIQTDAIMKPVQFSFTLLRFLQV